MLVMASVRPSGECVPDAGIREAARVMVARTCAAQGVPERVSDVETLRRVAILLRSAGSDEAG
jgi:hypothetical protein